MSTNLNRARLAPEGGGHGRRRADRPAGTRAAATPAVHAEVLARCAGDPVTADEVLAALTDAQRRGLRILPDPLPLTSSAAAYAERCGLRREDLFLPLLASLTDVDRFGTLRRASGRGVREWERLATVGGCELSDGRVYVDPRTRIWAQARATAVQRRRAHRALAIAFSSEGESERALWHRARGDLGAAGTHAKELLRVASARNGQGDARAAFRLADEAARHGDAPTRRRAAIVGGLAALSGGWLDDALDLLEPVVVGGDAGERREALAAFLAAVAMRRGTLPTIGAVRALCEEDPSPVIAGGRRGPLCGARCASGGQGLAHPRPRGRETGRGLRLLVRPARRRGRGG